MQYKLFNLNKIKFKLIIQRNVRVIEHAYFAFVEIHVSVYVSIKINSDGTTGMETRVLS